MTLRDLVEMAEARNRAAWNHTANLMALVANCHRDPKKRRRPFSAADFHPDHQRRRAEKETTADLKILKRVFIEGGG